MSQSDLSITSDECIKEIQFQNLVASIGRKPSDIVLTDNGTSIQSRLDSVKDISYKFKDRIFPIKQYKIVELQSTCSPLKSTNQASEQVQEYRDPYFQDCKVHLATSRRSSKNSSCVESKLVEVSNLRQRRKSKMSTTIQNREQVPQNQEQLRRGRRSINVTTIVHAQGQLDSSVLSKQNRVDPFMINRDPQQFGRRQDRKKSHCSSNYTTPRSILKNNYSIENSSRQSSRMSNASISNTSQKSVTFSLTTQQIQKLKQSENQSNTSNNKSYSKMKTKIRR